jgi:colicin import membrane protein
VTANSEYFHADQDDAFKKFLFVSIALHLSLAVVMLVRSLFSSDIALELQNAVRVDLVALPDKMPEQMTTQQHETPAEKPVNIEPKKDLLKEAKETQKKALDKMKALDAIEKMKKEMNQAAAKPAAAPAAKPAQFKGNFITSGNSFTGISRLRVNEYYENLVAKINEHFIVPEWLNNADLKASVVIELDERGYVVKKNIQTSSGNSAFDSACLAAVTEASPFSQPPDEVRGVPMMFRFPNE